MIAARQRAREQLGWEPAWDLDRALEAIVEWFEAYSGGAGVRETTEAQIEAFQAASA